MLNRVVEMSPCEAARLSQQTPFAFKIPVRKPNGDLSGPANMSQHEIEKALEGREFSELRVLPSALTEDEALLFRQLQELKLINVQFRPRPGSIESVAPGGYKNFQPRVLGLTARGAEFLELARDRKRLLDVSERLKTHANLTFTNLLTELRKASTNQIKEVDND